MFVPDQPEPLDKDAVLQVNRDLGARIRREGMEAVYIPDSDILIVTIGEPREGLMEPTRFDWFYVRIEPDTLEVLGYEIFNFKTQFLANNEIARDLFEDVIEQLLSGTPLRFEGEVAVATAWLTQVYSLAA